MPWYVHIQWHQALLLDDFIQQEIAKPDPLTTPHQTYSDVVNISSSTSSRFPQKNLSQEQEQVKNIETITNIWTR